MFKLIFTSLLFIFLINGYAFSQQKIKDFYLSNYKETGGQDWEVKGREAIIYDEYVDINKMDAKYHGKDNNTISIRSDQAKLNKDNTNVNLTDNVNITTQDGVKLTTNSLDWKRKDNQVTTRDWVQAENSQAMKISAKGLDADTNLKKADFQENVEVQFPDANGKDSTTINCDGPLEIEYNGGRAIFHKNVVVVNKQGKMFSDKTIVFFDSKAKKIIKIISEGSVKIIKDENVTFARRATYLGALQKIILEGRPRIIYFQKEGQKGFAL